MASTVFSAASAPAMANRLQDRSFHVPPPCDARLHCAVIAAIILTVLNQYRGFSKDAEDYISASVSCLSLAISPPAVFLAIVSVRIDPVNGQSGRLISHVLQEILKTIPSFTDAYPSSAVHVEVRIVPVIAPLQNVAPSVIHSVLFPTMGVSVNSIPQLERISAEASAGFGVTALERLVADLDFFSTFTHANASGSVVHDAASGNHDQSCKSSSRRNTQSRHNVAFSMLCSAAGDRRQPALAAKLTNLPQQASNFWN